MTKGGIKIFIEFIIIVLLCPNITYSTDFERINTDNGLSNNYVYDIVKDSKGFIWFATKDGLNRYDGYTFKVYRNSPSDSTSLSNNHVRCLFEDSEGNFWVGTNEGLNLFNRDKDSFTRYIDGSGEFSLSDGGIKDIEEDKQGNIWICTNGGGLNKFDKKTQTFKVFVRNLTYDKNGIFNNAPQKISIDSHGKFWITFWGAGIAKFDTETEIFHNFYSEKEKSHEISCRHTTSNFLDSDGMLWFSTFHGGLKKYNPFENTYTHFLPKSKSNRISHITVFDIIEDKKRNGFWISTLGGLDFLDKKTQQITSFKHNPTDPTSLSINNVSSLFLDDSGILWVGTYGGGVNKLDFNVKKFTNLKYNPSSSNNLSNSTITSVLELSDSLVWVGTRSGLNEINTSTKAVTNYFKNTKPVYFEDDRVSSLFEDSKGNIWIGTSSGLAKYNPIEKKSKIFKRNRKHFQDINSNIVKCIYEDDRGFIWVGTKGGLNRYNPETDSFTRYLHWLNKEDRDFAQDQILCITQDYNSLLWVGTERGLKSYHLDEFVFNRLKHENNIQKDFANKKINALAVDKHNNIWVGTANGLDVILNGKKEIKHYREEDGLPNNIINKLIFDKHGNLWISTSKGISKLNPNTEKFRNYNALDGLQNNEFIQGSGHLGKSGTIYFGGFNGFTFFNPDSITSNLTIPKVVITDFKLLNKTVVPDKDGPLKKSITEAEKISLSHKQSMFSFEFAALNYTHTIKNNYAYRLQEVGEDPANWIYTNQKREAHFMNVPPGEYVFTVKASNNDNYWNTKGTSIEIIITPPFWGTTVFRICVGLLLFSMTFIYVRYRNKRFYQTRKKLEELVGIRTTELQKLNNQLTKEKEKVSRLTQSKMRFFMNISNELRTPLTLILGLAEQLINKKELGNEIIEKHRVIERNGRRLLNLINQLMDISKIETETMELKVSEVDIKKFIIQITESFKALASKYNIDLKLHINQEEIIGWIDIDKIEKVIYNLLSNAIKFTPQEGEILVDVFKDDTKAFGSLLTIRVKDTGMGIPKSLLESIFDRFHQLNKATEKRFEGIGLGLAHTYDLLKLHKGDIKVVSEKGKGAEFTITLPIAKNAFESIHIVGQGIDNECLDKENLLTAQADTINHYLAYSVIEEEKILEHDTSIVLIVEDNADLLNYIKEELSQKYTVFTAINGQDGLEKALKLIPDLIITDLMMPIMDGVEMSKKIKENELTDHIPIILLTARSEEHDKQLGFGIGVDDYITKPFYSLTLNSRVENLIKTRNKLKEKFTKSLVKPKDSILSNQKSLPHDDKFVNKAIKIVEANIDDLDFTAEKFSAEIGMSKTQLYRKLKSLTGFSINLFIRNIRLTKAAELLRLEDEVNISEVAYQVGFRDPAYFTRCFTELYKTSPKKFANELKGIE